MVCLRNIYVCALALTVVASVAAAAAHSRHQHTQPHVGAAPVVKLDYITLAGRTLDSGVNAFIGVPYAAPPLGDLRWKAPQAPLQYEGVYNATRWTPPCLQTANSIISISSEDCLFLHVWTPATATASSNLPVFVWIHGGGFTMDAAQSYPGEHLAVGYGLEAVIVSMDYRMGPFGFLANDAIFAEGGGANFGLLDQEFAIQWVNKYVSLFGGNPNHVTVFGESAGAGSVALLMTARGGSNKLFHAAILESGSFTTYHETPTLATQAANTQRLAAAAGCTQTDGAEQLACLRKADAMILLQAGGQYWPVVDGVMFKDLPNKLVMNGEFMHIPAMFGTNTNEGAGFTTATLPSRQVYQTVAARFPQMSAANLSTLLDTLYPANRFASSHLRVAELMGDEMMACVSEGFATARAAAGVPTFRYRFNHAPENSYSQPVSLVAHATELPLVFNGTTYQGLETAEQPLVTKMMNTWKTFGIKHNPTTAGDPEWPQWTVDGRQMMVLDYEYSVETCGDYMPLHTERCEFWLADYASGDSSLFWPPKSLAHAPPHKKAAHPRRV